MITIWLIWITILLQNVVHASLSMSIMTLEQLDDATIIHLAFFIQSSSHMTATTDEGSVCRKFVLLINRRFCRTDHLEPCNDDRCESKLARFSGSSKHAGAADSFVPIYYYSILTKNANHRGEAPPNEQFLQFGNDPIYRDVISNGQSPFHLSDKLRKHIPFLDQQQINDNNDDVALASIISSVLEDKGGMHRIYHQKVHVMSASFHNAPQSKNRDSNTFHSFGTIVLFLPISDGIFIDVDDPLLLQPSSCNLHPILQQHDTSIKYDSTSFCEVSLDTDDTTAIDIEQPTFASSQHVLVFHLKFEVFGTIHTSTKGQQRHKITFDMDFSPSLHLRYPLPNQVTNYQTVYIAKPIINSGIYNNHLGVQTYSYPIISNHDNTFGITLQVPTGLYSHFFIVSATTTLISILGTLVSLRYLSKISVWY